jgi:hypothetical protein
VLPRRWSALRSELARHWFSLANSLFWLFTGLEVYSTATVLQAQVYQLPAFVLLRVAPGWFFCQWLHQALQRRSAWRELQGWRRVALVVALLSAYAVVISLLLRGLRLGFGIADPAMTPVRFWVYVLGLELRLMVWAGFYLLVAVGRDLLAMQVRGAELELAMARAQISMLSAAFQPHFLMNAINTLIACRYDPEAVEAAGEGLAGYLRYSLNSGATEYEPLAIQLEALGNYISVEELRFGERLHCCIVAQPQVIGLQVPCFLLQLLVENALKHGSAHDDGRLRLRVELQRQADQLQLRVSNSGQLRPVARRQGVGYGLDSLRKRLNLLYGSRACLELEQVETSVVATVRLPLYQ